MLLGKMYVRCPADQEYPTDPRVFICGQITRVDEFGRTVKVRIYDPFSYLVFFENLPKGEIILPEWMVQRCVFFIDSIVIVNNCECKVLSYSKNKDGYFYYYANGGFSDAERRHFWNRLDGDRDGTKVA